MLKLLELEKLPAVKEEEKNRQKLDDKITCNVALT